MHILDSTVVGTLHKASEPSVYLLADSFLRELVALQTLRTASRRIGMSRRGVSHTQDAPLAFRQVYVNKITFHQ